MIALERVGKSYPTPFGRKVVLHDATVEVPSGHNIGILGGNGAGKSTLIRLLAGTEMPDRGHVRRGARVSCDRSRCRQRQRGAPRLSRKSKLSSSCFCLSHPTK